MEPSDVMIKELIKILPPPSQRDASGVVWGEAEKEIGVQFPKDFKEFVEVYGGGLVDGFVWVLNPFSSNSNISFEKSKYFIEAYGVMRQEFPLDYVRPTYPEEYSFLPWAVTDNGETFVWVVEGAADSWKVAIHSSDQGEEEIYNWGCVEFLLKLLDGKISSKILPAQFPPAGLGMHAFMTAD